MAKNPEDKKESLLRLKRSLRESDRKRVARGQDLYGYGEQKQKINLSLTPTAIANITELAKEAGLSRSETIEQLFRNHYKTLSQVFKDS